MRVELTRKYNFSAAHFLPNVPEDHKCRRLHGHSYELEVAVRGEVDQQIGWLIDYADIDKQVKPLVAELDHRTLNDIAGLENSTSEELCGWLWNRLKDHLPGLYRVTVAESRSSSCHYFGD